MDYKYFSGKTIDDIEFDITEIFWVLDKNNALIIRPFIYIDDAIGYLDTLMSEPKVYDESVVLTTDMFLEELYRLSSSRTHRYCLLDYNTRITEDKKLFRKEALEMQKLYTKFARRYLDSDERQNKIFSIESIEKRQTELTKISFDNQSVFWQIASDDASIVRPFMKLKENKIGYLDNCEISTEQNKQEVLSSYELAALIDSISESNKKRETTIDEIYDILSLPCRITQKQLARISQIYHETAEKYAEDQHIIRSAFMK